MELDLAGDRRTARQRAVCTGMGLLGKNGRLCVAGAPRMPMAGWAVSVSWPYLRGLDAISHLLLVYRWETMRINWER